LNKASLFEAFGPLQASPGFDVIKFSAIPLKFLLKYFSPLSNICETRRNSLCVWVLARVL